MKIQTSLMVLLLSSGSLFAKEVTNKSPEAEQVGYSFGYLMGKVMQIPYKALIWMPLVSV